jgi:hypothetical protein
MSEFTDKLMAQADAEVHRLLMAMRPGPITSGEVLLLARRCMHRGIDIGLDMAIEKFGTSALALSAVPKRPI